MADSTVLEWRSSLGAEATVPKRVPPLSLGELALATSLALDLAEGRLPGHGQRVCYIAMAVASRIALGTKESAGVFFGALMHDLGVPFVSRELTQRVGLDEDKIFGQHPPLMLDRLLSMLPDNDALGITRLIATHSAIGADCAEDLRLPPEAVTAIRCHHEHWDGSGHPGVLSAAAIPIEARIVALAHLAECAIAAQSSALSARASAADATYAMAGRELDPDLVNAFQHVAHSDSFWLAYYDADLADILVEAHPMESHKRSRRITMDFAHTFGDVVDARCGYPAGQSAQTANLARQVAQRVGLEDGNADLVWWATLFRDVGNLGVPSRIMAKSDILSVEEMQIMQAHPMNSRMVVDSLPGMAEVAAWIGMHHEWPNGKGYPESLDDAEIPIEAKIISLVDVYNALTSERPYRRRLDRDGALGVIRGASGSQLDAQLVELLSAVV